MKTKIKFEILALAAISTIGICTYANANGKLNSDFEFKDGNKDGICESVSNFNSAIDTEVPIIVVPTEVLCPEYKGELGKCKNSCSEQIDKMPESVVPFFEISDSDREIVHNIVAGEAIGESYRCKKLVAQCLLNAMTINDYSVSQVRKAYKYSGYWPEAKKLYPKAWEDVEKAVSEVFDKGNTEVYDSIEYFYSTRYCKSKWHESLRFVTEDGCTRFFSKFDKAN